MAVNSETYAGGVIRVACPKCGAAPMVRCMSATGTIGNAHKSRRELVDVAVKGKTTHKWTADDPKAGMTVPELQQIVREIGGLELGVRRSDQIRAGITIGGKLQWLSIEVPAVPESQSVTGDDGSVTGD